MISRNAASEGAPQTFVIQPNSSMSWRTLAYAYCGIATTVISIGLFCFCMGLPLVMPFAGVEVVLVGAGLYWSAWRGGVREVITISEQRVVVESGRTAPERRDEFQRYWARVVLDQPGGWYPSRLLIRCHGRQTEVGRFLNEQERRGLAEQLRQALLHDEAFKLELQTTSADRCRGLEHVA